MVKPITPSFNYSSTYIKNLVVDLPLFDRGSTQASNLVDRSNFGTLSGAGVVWANSIFGPCLSFGTGTEKVTLPMVNQFTSITRMSMEMVAYAGDTSVTRRFIDNGQFAFDVTNGSAGFCDLSGNFVAATTNPSSTSSGRPLSMTAPNHMIMTYDDAGDRKMHLYVNGAEVTYGTQTAGVGALTTVTSTWNIGNRAAGDRTLNGKIVYMRVWNNRILNAQECRKLYNDPWQIYTRPWYQPFNSVSASTAIKMQAVRGWSWAV